MKYQGRWKAIQNEPSVKSYPSPTESTLNKAETAGKKRATQNIHNLTSGWKEAALTIRGFSIWISQKNWKRKDVGDQSSQVGILSPLHYCEWCVNQGRHIPPTAPAASPFPAWVQEASWLPDSTLKRQIPREVLAFAQDTLPEQQERSHRHTVGTKCRSLENWMNEGRRMSIRG